MEIWPLYKQSIVYTREIRKEFVFIYMYLSGLL